MGIWAGDDNPRFMGHGVFGALPGDEIIGDPLGFGDTRPQGSNSSLLPTSKILYTKRSYSFLKNQLLG
jgi:hypothetical protein